MKRTRLLAILAIAVVAGLMVTGCDRQMGMPQDVTPDVKVARMVPYPPEVFTIWAGQNMNAGNVTVWFDETNLYIKYQTTGNWWISETHAHVAKSLNGIPQKNGNPVPGQFEFKDAWSQRVQTCTYTIPKRDGWQCDVDLYIATHCVVSQLVGGKYVNEQTGWAGPHRFPGKNWALYIKYRMRCYKDVDLPPDSVTMSVVKIVRNSDADANFAVTLSDVPGDSGDYYVWNGRWRGWCVQLGVDILQNIPYRVWLWSNQDPNLPLYLRDDAWDNINYLINHKLPGATAREIQAAIWYLQGDDALPSSPIAQQMIQEAQLYGDGWHPGSGQWVGVLMDSPLDIQLVMIEVDP